MFKHIGIMAMVATLAFGCASKDKKNEETAVKPAAESEVASLPTDAEIAEIVHTAHMGEIEAARLARLKSKNEDIKKFADMMIKDHEEMDHQNRQIALKNNIIPDESVASRSMMTSASDERSSLETLQGEDFDKAYINQQVATHITVLHDIDNTLLPNAKTPEMQAMLKSARVRITNHLAMAADIQKKIGAIE